MESRYSDREIEDLISVWISDVGMSYYEDFTVILDRGSNLRTNLAQKLQRRLLLSIIITTDGT